MINTKFRTAVTFMKSEDNGTENGLLDFECVGDVPFLSRFVGVNFIIL